MKTSIPMRLASGFGAFIAASGLVVTALAVPASAAEGTIDYTLTTDDPIKSGVLDGSNDPCEEDTLSGDRYYKTGTLTVSTTGEYTFRDQSSNDPNLTDGFVVVKTADGDPLSDSIEDCVATYDQTPDPTTLQAGVSYRVLLTSYFSLDAGNVQYSYIGPGVATLSVDGEEPEGVSFEEAQAACVPGAAAPAGYNVIDGTSRSETLRGTEGNDLIRGLGGQDTLVGLGGDDILCGGVGQDTLRGGAGEDFLFGEAGQDALYGEADDDVLAGGDGNDFHDGGAGSDVALDTVGSNTFRNIESRTLAPVTIS